MKKEKIHILLIGPCTNLDAGLIGGATISFGYLVDYFKKNKIAFSLVNTQTFPFGLKKLLNPFFVLFRVLQNLRKTDVVFLNSSRGGTKYLLPVLFFLARLLKKKFVFRPFGGNIKDYTASYNSLQKKIFKSTALKADIFFLQTEELIQYYQSFSNNIKQLKTSREIPPERLFKKDKVYSKRFVYLGYVNSAKGVDLILEANNTLDDSYIIHVYGPIKEEHLKVKLSKRKDIYKGVLKRDDVLSTLSEYDVLLLPTFYEGEGYPGVLLEAYSLGLPVISTNWKAIPEIVQHGQTGRLIEPRSLAALLEAIQFFNEKNYPSYAEKARKYFIENFSVDQVTTKVYNEIKALF